MYWCQSRFCKKVPTISVRSNIGAGMLRSNFEPVAPINVGSFNKVEECYTSWCCTGNERIRMFPSL